MSPTPTVRSNFYLEWPYLSKFERASLHRCIVRTVYFRNLGAALPVNGLKVAVTTDSAVFTQTNMKPLSANGKATDGAIAGVLLKLRGGAQTVFQTTRAHREQS